MYVTFQQYIFAFNNSFKINHCTVRDVNKKRHVTYGFDKPADIYLKSCKGLLLPITIHLH